MPTSSAVWFITGASKGFGLALAKALLAHGHRVAATSRALAELTAAVPAQDNFLPLAVDLTAEASVQQAIAHTVATFGRLDVVVNNAGYGLVGALEELTDQEVRQNFDVNVFAMLHVLRHALPHLRAQGAGHVFNFSSTAGYIGYPGNVSYNASKYAVVGLSEALAAEVAPFGIRVTVVAPGYFRTNFLNGGSMRYAQHQLDAYQAIHAMKGFIEGADGQQAGDPDRAAQVLMQLATEAQPPLHLLLGTDAYQGVTAKLTDLQAEFAAWQAVSTSTDFPA